MMHKEIWCSKFFDKIFDMLYALAWNLNSLEIISQDYLFFLQTKQIIVKNLKIKPTFLKMSSPSDKIASETKNSSFSRQTVEKFLALMAT